MHFKNYSRNCDNIRTYIGIFIFNFYSQLVNIKLKILMHKTSNDVLFVTLQSEISFLVNNYNSSQKLQTNNIVMSIPSQ